MDLYPRCLFRAAEADYHQGAWFSATQLYQKAFTAHGLMAERPFDLGKHADLSRALFGLGVIQATAVKGGPPYEGFISRSLEEGGATDLLREGLASLPEPPWWDALPLEELADRTLDQLGRPTFADAGALRSVKWSALGTCWTIEFANSYADTLVAERLAAAAQVILADLALRDPALLPTQVTIEVTAGAAGTEMDLGNNGGQRRVLAGPSPSAQRSWQGCCQQARIRGDRGHSRCRPRDLRAAPRRIRPHAGRRAGSGPDESRRLRRRVRHCVRLRHRRRNVR